MVIQATDRGRMFEFGRQAFNEFMEGSLPLALAELSEPLRRVYYYTHLMPPDSFYTRRLLVISEPGEAVVKVFIEASYEFFEGDVHYYVRQVGTVSRQQAEPELRQLLTAAFEQLMAWQSSHESIWEEVSGRL